jgi:hypothetical protein
MITRLHLLLLLPCSWAALFADGPKDNIPENVRPIPPIGIEVTTEIRTKLEKGLANLESELEKTRKALTKKPEMLRLLPDVEVFAKAVRYALEGKQFYKKQEFEEAEKQLAQGMDRATSLRGGEAPWTRQKGLVVRGYRSRIDGSVQPYGLIVPESYDFEGSRKHRLDFWFHGRGERLSELSFIAQRKTQRGHFAPHDTIVLHPYGRYSCANKFAGEIDLFEALEHARSDYRIDEDRIIPRGFSMGGASCWQFAVHYADLWCAAAPGAGFSETREFLEFFQDEILKPTDYERKLWRLYDCTDYALNLVHCPTVAYSGEMDRQKQAAEVMARALAKENLELVHIIGKRMGHRYDEVSKGEIERRISAIAERGRERVPRKVFFTTPTLRYNKMRWIEVDALLEHWQRSNLVAEIKGDLIEVSPKGVKAFTLKFGSGECPLAFPRVSIDNQNIATLPPVRSDRSWKAHFRKLEKKWMVVDSPSAASLAKKHGLQGPIDDAFLDSFLFVQPTGKAINPMAGEWVDAELKRAIHHWKIQFRGDARVKNDVDLTAEDVSSHNLVLWGDTRSNATLAKIADKLPIRWDEKTVRVGKRTYEASHHAPILIYPNPLNPDRYVVLNSGFTYREYAYLNNARQIPMLPDWAIIDLREKPGSQRPGRIAKAGFFDENWLLKP